MAKKRGNIGVRVMFPSSHDLTLENYDLGGREILLKLLEDGNKVLIVSKPYPEVVRRICDEFAQYHHLIQFRFTITAMDNAILLFWEPGAPPYEERKTALAYAYTAGFETSVSAEPMLDASRIDELIDDLSPFITHSLWIGKLNPRIPVQIDPTNEAETAELARVKAGQTDDSIREIYLRHRNNALIRWKGSIKDVVGLERAPRPGMDI